VIRWSLIVALIAAGAYGIQLHQGAQDGAAIAAEPEPVAFDQAAAEADLEKRFEAFAALKKSEDYVALYDMVDPSEREVLDLRSFLSYYILVTHGMWFAGAEFDWAQGTAIVSANIHAELRTDRLPAGYRVDNASPEDTHVEQTLLMTWVRNGGEWYFRVDQDVLRGQNADGRVVETFETPSETGAPR